MIEHTPVVPIYRDNGAGKLVGYVCMHCGGILTPNYQWSLGESKAHLVRVAAAKLAKKAYKKGKR